ncbi:MAG: radical SAM protein [Anaerovoracaceae bacterium]
MDPTGERTGTFRIGPIRPPSEATSLLLQVTNGCTWNKCRFCRIYRHTKFKAYSADSIRRDIDTMVLYAQRARRHRDSSGRWDIDSLNREIMMSKGDERQCFYMVANWLVNGGENVFLQDGNTTALSSGRLTDVLVYLRQAFPGIKRITSYGRAENLSRISAEEFAELKAAGLDRIHSGFESGSDAVLSLINKGTTAQQEITAGRNIKAGGIELSVYFMPGIGGRDLTAENPEGMAEVINSISPDFVRIRTAVVKPGTELYDDFLTGKYTLCSDDEKILEIRRLIEASETEGTVLVSDHIINLLQQVSGRLDTDRNRMLGIIDGYLGMPEEERVMFRLARRMAKVISPDDMKRLSEADIEDIRHIMYTTADSYSLEVKINNMMCSFI